MLRDPGRDPTVPGQSTETTYRFQSARGRDYLLRVRGSGQTHQSLPRVLGSAFPSVPDRSTSLVVSVFAPHASPSPEKETDTGPTDTPSPSSTPTTHLPGGPLSNSPSNCSNS